MLEHNCSNEYYRVSGQKGRLTEDLFLSFSKTGLVSSSWERQFYFTQGGNLMSQARGDVAGGLVMDIDNCSVMAVDCEDRRYCFQITSFDGKK